MQVSIAFRGVLKRRGLFTTGYCLYDPGDYRMYGGFIVSPKHFWKAALQSLSLSSLLGPLSDCEQLDCLAKGEPVKGFRVFIELVSFTEITVTVSVRELENFGGSVLLHLHYLRSYPPCTG